MSRTRHARERAEDGTLISRLTAVGLAMPAALAQGAEIERQLQKVPSQEWLRDIGRKLPLDGPAPLYVPEGLRLRPATWQEWVRDAVIRVQALNASLVPYFPFLEVELIALVNDVVLSGFIDQGRIIASLPSGGTGNMSIYACPLAQFTAAWASLRDYYEREIL